MKNSLVPNGSADFNAHSLVVPFAQAAAELQLLATQSLADHPNFRALVMRQAIHVQAEGGRIVVNGSVPSYYHKQLLQETLRRVAGIVCVENRVAVVYPSGLVQE